MPKLPEMSGFLLSFPIDFLIHYMYLHIYIGVLAYYVQCLHVIGQVTFQSLPSASMKEIAKQSQYLDILGNLEIPARTSLGKKAVWSSEISLVIKTQCTKAKYIIYIGNQLEFLL